MFRFVGDWFFYNMVRILVGTLLEVGRGRRSPDDIPQILNKKNDSMLEKQHQLMAYIYGKYFIDGKTLVLLT